MASFAGTRTRIAPASTSRSLPARVYKTPYGTPKRINRGAPGLEPSSARKHLKATVTPWKAARKRTAPGRRSAKRLRTVWTLRSQGRRSAGEVIAQEFESTRRGRGGMAVRRKGNYTVACPTEAAVETKQTVRDLLDRLPDDCSLDDVLYHLCVLQAVETGRGDARAGRLLPHNQVAEELRKKRQLGPAE
jgi:hypothetical protein